MRYLQTFINRFAVQSMALALVACGVLVYPDLAQAQVRAKTLGDMVNSTYDSFYFLQTFLSVLSYVLGIFFSITSLQQFRNHVEDPSRNPLQAALLRMVAAAFFLFSPTAANYLVATLSGDGGGLANVDVSTVRINNKIDDTIGSGAGLENAVGRFVVDVASPLLDNAIPILCYVAGITLMMVGLKRLALANGDGPQAPGGLGTMGTFLVAAMLMSFGYFMYLLQGSIFGDTALYDFGSINSGASADVVKRANETLWAVFVFLRIVGYISVLRGLFMLRALAEGANVSMVAVMTHWVAGAMLANGGMLIQVVQCTFVKDAAKFAVSTLGAC